MRAEPVLIQTLLEMGAAVQGAMIDDITGDSS